jgi:hypothetical protein
MKKMKNKTEPEEPEPQNYLFKSGWLYNSNRVKPGGKQ